jgi:hypothetical protein
MDQQIWRVEGGQGQQPMLAKSTSRARNAAINPPKVVTHYLIQTQTEQEACNKPIVSKDSSVPTDNDPTAGSPTVTLLRLLLPLNDKVQ